MVVCVSLSLQQALKFVYLMRHGGENHVNGVEDGIKDFEDSVVATLLGEEHLQKLLDKWPLALGCIEFISTIELIDHFDSDGDHKWDKDDALVFRNYLQERKKQFARYWAVCDQN